MNKHLKRQKFILVINICVEKERKKEEIYSMNVFAVPEVDDP